MARKTTVRRPQRPKQRYQYSVRVLSMVLYPRSMGEDMES